jgi:haloalkane dehalogenase
MTTTDHVIRTPDACFAGLPDFAFAPHYLDVGGARGSAVRMHYLDENPAGSVTALMLHGEPTWSFLYRHMIPVVAAAGFRVVAPDWIGFGRSDKYSRVEDYSYELHVDSLRTLIGQLDLRRIVLVGQDWGGPIGFRALSEMPERFSGVLVTNTLLPTGEPPPLGVAGWPGEVIRQWVDYASRADDLAIDEIVAGVCVTRPAPDVLAGYRAPFPTRAHKAGPLAFPRLIPIDERMPGYAENRRAWQVLERFDRPFVTAFSDSDPSTRAWETVFQQRVPGARGRRHPVIERAGHFVQEEQGVALARVLVELMREVAQQ